MKNLPTAEQNDSRDARKNRRADLPAGQVDVTPHGSGWLLVEIGRERYTKRFNLSYAEAEQLAEHIQHLLPGPPGI